MCVERAMDKENIVYLIPWDRTQQLRKKIYRKQFYYLQ